MFNRDICVIDLETTGTLENKFPPRIIQIGMVKVDKTSLKVKDKYFSLVNPQEKLDQFIVDYTGISQEMVDVAPTFEGQSEFIVDFAKDTVLSAFPISFDLPILQSEFGRVMGKCPIDRRAIDIGTMCRIYMGAFANPLKQIDGQNVYSLDNCLSSMGMKPVEGRHNALNDAMAEAGLLIEILSGFIYLKERLDYTEVQK